MSTSMIEPVTEYGSPEDAGEGLFGILTEIFVGLETKESLYQSVELRPIAPTCFPYMMVP